MLPILLPLLVLHCATSYWPHVADAAVLTPTAAAVTKSLDDKGLDSDDGSNQVAVPINLNPNDLDPVSDLNKLHLEPAGDKPDPNNRSGIGPAANGVSPSTQDPLIMESFSEKKASGFRGDPSVEAANRADKPRDMDSDDDFYDEFYDSDDSGIPLNEIRARHESSEEEEPDNDDSEPEGYGGSKVYPSDEINDDDDDDDDDNDNDNNNGAGAGQGAGNANNNGDDDDEEMEDNEDGGQGDDEDEEMEDNQDNGNGGGQGAN